MQQFVAGILLSVFAAMPLAAQSGTPVAQPKSPTEAERLPHSPWSYERCLLGLSYGAPLKLAIGIGGGLLYQDQNGGADICTFAAAKLGLGGARGSVGIGRSLGALGGGAAVSGGVLRTFGAPTNAMRMRTYVGGSLHLFPLLAIGGEIGWYTRIGTDPAAAPSRSMITWSAGFGF